MFYDSMFVLKLGKYGKFSPKFHTALKRLDRQRFWHDCNRAMVKLGTNLQLVYLTEKGFIRVLVQMDPVSASNLLP